jgi:hypothetical protein
MVRSDNNPINMPINKIVNNSNHIQNVKLPISKDGDMDATLQSQATGDNLQGTNNPLNDIFINQQKELRNVTDGFIQAQKNPLSFQNRGNSNQAWLNNTNAIRTVSANEANTDVVPNDPELNNLKPDVFNRPLSDQGFNQNYKQIQTNISNNENIEGSYVESGLVPDSNINKINLPLVSLTQANLANNAEDVKAGSKFLDNISEQIDHQDVIQPKESHQLAGNLQKSNLSQDELTLKRTTTQDSAEQEEAALPEEEVVKVKPEQVSLSGKKIRINSAGEQFIKLNINLGINSYEAELNLYQLKDLVNKEDKTVNMIQTKNDDNNSAKLINFELDLNDALMNTEDSAKTLGNMQNSLFINVTNKPELNNSNNADDPSLIPDNTLKSFKVRLGAQTIEFKNGTININ